MEAKTITSEELFGDSTKTISTEELFGKTSQTVSSEELFGEQPKESAFRLNAPKLHGPKDWLEAFKRGNITPAIRAAKITKEEFIGGIGDIKRGVKETIKSDSILGTIPKKEKPLPFAGFQSPQQALRVGKTVMGGLRSAWSPITGGSRAWFGEPAEQAATRMGAPPIVSKGIGLGAELAPQILIPAGTSKKIAQPLIKRLAYGPKYVEEIAPGLATRFEKITAGLKEIKITRKAQEELYTATRAQRIAKARQIGEKIKAGKLDPEKGFAIQKKALQGEMPRVAQEEYKEVANLFTEQDRVDILRYLEEVPDFNDFERIAAKEGFLLMATGKDLPVMSQIKLLQRVLPEDFIKVLKSKRTLVQKSYEYGVEGANLWRAILSSGDLSAGFRQGVFAAPRHPIKFAKAFAAQFKYAFSEKQFRLLMKDINRNPLPAGLHEKIAFTDLGGLTAEERFIGVNLAEKIPFVGRIVRGSSRAYTGFLNKFRYDIAKDFLKRNPAILESNKGIEQLSAFINAATGRGNLRGMLKTAQPLLNAGFFSPRLIAARVKLLNPMYYTNIGRKMLGIQPLHPAVRKEALTSLISFLGAGMTVMGLAKLRGAEVGLDPRSSDFGKIKVGNTRYDVWGGFQQYMRVIGQLVSGKMVSSTTGREYTLGEGYKPTTRLDIATRFLESKANPIISFAFQLGRGRNFTGEQFDVPAEVINRMIPMVWQDMYDIYKEGGLKEVPWATPSFFGVGMQTYGKQLATEKLVRKPGGRMTTKTKLKPVPNIGEDIMHKIRGTKPTEYPIELSELFAEIEQIRRKVEDYPRFDIQKQRQQDMEILNRAYNEIRGVR